LCGDHHRVATAYSDEVYEFDIPYVRRLGTRYSCAVVSCTSVIGVHIAAGVVWLAQAADDGSFVDDRVDRLEFQSGGLEPGRELAELVESLEDVFSRLAPHTVAILAAGSSVNRPPMADMLRRGRLEAAVMIAASRISIRLVEVSHDDVKRTIGARPSDKKALTKLLAERVPSPPKRWPERVVAYAAAIFALEGGRAMTDGVWVEIGTLTLPYGTVRTLHTGVSEVRLLESTVTQTRRVGKRVSLFGREENLVVSEAMFLARIDHRNVAKVFDVAEPAGIDPQLRVFEILMPYYERGSIYDAMMSGVRFRPSEARDLAVRALRGLGHLHDQQRVLHRDVKPGNLFLADDDSLVKVGDFGEAMSMDAADECDPLLSPQFWTPPETFTGSRYSVRSEIYALGMTLREMLSGPMPHDDYTREDLGRRLAAGRHPVKDRDLGFEAHVPEGLRRIARKATRRTAGDRYGCAETMISDLLRVRFIDWGWPDMADHEVVWSGTGGGDEYRVVARPVRGRGWRARAERRYPSGWRRTAQVGDADGPDPLSAASVTFAAIDRQFTRA